MNIQALQKVMPVSVIEQINVEKFNTLTLSHFLSQCYHESMGFKVVYENLNYSVNALRMVFSKYFPTDKKAITYARNREMIGSLVYANRMGNGDEMSRDGYKYRGRGFIQLTGKDNYKAFSDYCGEDCVSEPSLVATKYPLLSAMFFFESNNLFDIAKKGSGEEIIKALTKRINGGYNGLQSRITHFKTFYSLLNS